MAAERLWSLAGVLSVLAMAGWTSHGGALAAHADAQLPVARAARRPVRVALGAERGLASVQAPGVTWRLLDREGHVLRRARGVERWGVERRGHRLRVLVEGEREGPWVDGPIRWLSETGDTTVEWHGKAYRGTVTFVAADTGTIVVNTLDVEDYLRGVVPLELGDRAVGEHAAMEAQAVAARSYTYERMNTAELRDWDVRASESDQVYGGVDAETAAANLAIDATAGVVLTWEGRPIFVPYHSTCGGTTAAPGEVWRDGTRASAYLRSVSDRIPGSERDWCEISPRYRWERAWTAPALGAAVERYLRAVVPEAPATALGAVRSVRVVATTPSGRASEVEFGLDRGSWRVGGNDARAVLRSVAGVPLPSSRFTLEAVIGKDGHVMQLTARGSGNGHGVGLCQWGAIGRARAGQDFRMILQAYFPGTALARVA